MSHCRRCARFCGCWRTAHRQSRTHCPERKKDPPSQARRRAEGPNFSFSLKREEDWKAKNKELAKNCELLLGADGTQVHPEIPIALGYLDYAGKRIEKSLEATTLQKFYLADAYVKGACEANSFARKLLEGRSERRAGADSVKVPVYIKKADKELLRYRERGVGP